ncbi:MAG TPA: MOSC domain-containing protein [Deferrisomatales bacterium]|nr:MOSC domain-containing protein [Deferrisomatales bacterium]
MATLVSINISRTKGVRKTPVEQATVGPEGLAGDAHAGDWHRMVSLLAEESIAKMQAAGLDVKAGDFAENLTTRGVDLLALPLGTRLGVGDQVVLELTQHGKECHNRCAIYYQAGDCVMPREGVFAKVICPGEIHSGDPVEVREGDGGD